MDSLIKLFMISDGALAQRLQSEEIKTHLHGNRQRNHQIREDVPRARQEQVSEVEEACKQGLNLLIYLIELMCFSFLSFKIIS